MNLLLFGQATTMTTYEYQVIRSMSDAEGDTTLLNDAVVAGWQLHSVAAMGTSSSVKPVYVMKRERRTE